MSAHNEHIHFNSFLESILDGALKSMDLRFLLVSKDDARCRRDNISRETLITSTFWCFIKNNIARRGGRDQVVLHRTYGFAAPRGRNIDGLSLSDGECLDLLICASSSGLGIQGLIVCFYGGTT